MYMSIPGPCCDVRDVVDLIRWDGWMHRVVPCELEDEAMLAVETAI